MGKGSCMRIGVRVLRVGGTCRKGSISYSLHIASQCFHPVQYVVADVSATPDTRRYMAFACRRSQASSGSSVAAPGGPGLGINAVGIPGVACEERVAAAVVCCACTCRTEMDRCCAGAVVFVVESCMVACAVASVITIMAPVRLRNCNGSGNRVAGICWVLLAFVPRVGRAA